MTQFPGPKTAWNEEFYGEYRIDSLWVTHALVNKVTMQAFIMFHDRDDAAFAYLAINGFKPGQKLHGGCRLTESDDKKRTVVGMQVVPMDARWGEVNPTEYKVLNPQYVFNYKGQ